MRKSLIVFSLFSLSVGNLWGDFRELKIGLTTDEILKLQGMPTRISKFPRLKEEIWWYNNSSISFTNGAVTEWYTPNLLKDEDRVASQTIAPSKTFEIGSSKQEVLNAQGSPNRISKYKMLGEEIWWYRNSTITFKNGVVSEWDNCTNSLNVQKVNVHPNAPLFRFGSSRSEVLASQGTPRRISKLPHLKEEIWWYGASSITFVDDRVFDWDNYGELKYEIGNVVDDDESFRGINQIDGDPDTANDEINNVTSFLNKIHMSFHGLMTANPNPTPTSKVNGVDILAPAFPKEPTSGHSVPDIFQTVISPKHDIPIWEYSQSPISHKNTFRGLMIGEDTNKTSPQNSSDP